MKNLRLTVSLAVFLFFLGAWGAKKAADKFAESNCTAECEAHKGWRLYESHGWLYRKPEGKVVEDICYCSTPFDVWERETPIPGRN